MRRPGLLLLAALLLGLLLLLLPPFRREPPPSSPPAPPRSAAAPRSAAPRGDPARAPVPSAGPAPAPLPDAPPAPGDLLRIHGRVVAAGGAAVPGARVEVRAWSGEEPEVKWTVVVGASGPGGEFSFDMDRALAAKGFGIETAAEGFLEGWVALKAADYDEQRGVEVPVEGARSVVGRVVDEYARPIPESTVQLWYGSETTWPTTVDAGGRFRTPARAPRRAFDLIVEAPGYPRRVVPLPAAPAEESTDAGDLVFRRGGRLAGIAVDAGGAPVAGLAIELTGITGASPSTRTDAAGRFEFTDLGEGTVGVWVDARGASRSWRGGLGSVPVGSTDVKVIVSAETAVTLRFVDAATGAPVLVTESAFGVWPAGTADHALPDRGTSSSSPYGSERVTVASGARYDVLVRSPGFEDARVAGFDVPDVDEVTVDVPMRRAR